MIGRLALVSALIAGPASCGSGGSDAERGSAGSAGSGKNTPVSANAQAFILGINIHSGGGSASGNDQVAALMKQRNFRTARMDMFASSDQALLRDQVRKIKSNGGTVEVSLQISYQWDHKCNQNLASVEQDSYQQTVAGVDKVKDIVHDFELLNETQLRPEILKEVAWNTVGTSTKPYEGKPCVATLTAVLRGMSRAINDVRASSGLPLRTILGVVGRDFGFLTFMQQKGVLFDVVGYHIYPNANHASLLSDPWFGPGGLIAQLAVFGKPVRINEFNCGEIYSSSYDNRAGATVTETCLKSLGKHLTDLRNQRILNLESVHLYELLDEPGKPAPENRFGLMYDLSSPKVHLHLATAFAGGTLSSAERHEITRRGLLSDTQIDGMRAAPQPAAAPAPASAPAPAAPRAQTPGGTSSGRNRRRSPAASS